MLENIEQLEASNEERIKALVAGKVGVPVQIPPHTFDMIRLRIYLEEVLRLLSDPDSDHLAEAKSLYTKEAADLIDKLESASRKAMLTNPGGLIES